MRPIWIGLLLGAANVFVIGLGLSAVAHDLDVGAMVVMLGVVPGTTVGALIGWIARLTRRWPAWPRRVAMLAPAIGLVVVLGATFAMDDFILVACVPTLVAVLVLERATRLVVPQPLPVAHVRRA